MNDLPVCVRDFQKCSSMINFDYKKRKFLFLQGPHGPFQYQLAKALIVCGVEVCKICFNAGDRFFWKDRKTCLDFTDTLEAWPDFVKSVLAQNYTDLVIYGDSRYIHTTAAAHAKKLGIIVHYFEEGYLRPYWVTYERDGVNGASRIAKTTIAQMRKDIQDVESTLIAAPVLWGDMRQHVFLGAIYHWFVMFRNRKFPHYIPHRGNTVRSEFGFHIRKILNRLPHNMTRWYKTKRLVRSGAVYHLCLLQLSHDASIQQHSTYTGMDMFMRECVDAFSKYAPKHHHLIFKAHPLEDERTPLAKLARLLARDFNATDRIHYIRGGKLAQILDFAASVVTVNSTAAQQALWRGLPVKALGESVYNKPELTSDQNLKDFFAKPKKPNMAAYRDYRRYLLATNQIPGGYYKRSNRRRLLLQIVELVLSEENTYKMLKIKSAAPVQQLVF